MQQKIMEKLSLPLEFKRLLKLSDDKRRNMLGNV